MYRRGRKKEDWGGDDGSDDEGSNNKRGSEGMDSVLKRASNKSSYSLTSRRIAEEDGAAGGVGSDGKPSSDEEGGEDGDSDAEQGGGAGADISKNAKEKDRDNSHGPRRDHEAIQTAKMREQGFEMDDEDDDDDEQEEKSYMRNKQQREFHSRSESESAEQRAARKQKAKAHAAEQRAAHVQSSDAQGDVSMDGHDADDEPDHEIDDPKVRQMKMKALFDKSKEEKFMSFHADDPLKPNPNKKRAAAREDEELDEEENANADPWLKQAAEDAERARHRDDADGYYDPTRSNKQLKASTDVFEQEKDAPIFDQSKARVVLLRHLKPGETVLRAVKRLGEPLFPSAAGGAAGAKTPGAPLKTKMKNVRTKPRPGEEATAASAAAPAALTPEQIEAEKQRKAAFNELTEAAQGFLSSGAVEIYHDTYEKISKIVEAEQARLAAAAAFAARQQQQQSATTSASSDARAKAAARLQRKRDARAAGLPEPDSSSSDEEEDYSRPRPAASAAVSSSASSSAASAAPSASPSEVEWLYRYPDNERLINGPYSSRKMAEWQASGLLEKDVLLKRVTVPENNTWLKLEQVDFAQPHLTKASTTNMNASSATSSASGYDSAFAELSQPAKKKFKF